MVSIFAAFLCPMVLSLLCDPASHQKSKPGMPLLDLVWGRSGMFLLLLLLYIAFLPSYCYFAFSYFIARLGHVHCTTVQKSNGVWLRPDWIFCIFVYSFKRKSSVEFNFCFCEQFHSLSDFISHYFYQSSKWLLGLCICITSKSLPLTSSIVFPLLWIETVDQKISGQYNNQQGRQHGSSLHSIDVGEMRGGLGRAC